MSSPKSGLLLKFLLFLDDDPEACITHAYELFHSHMSPYSATLDIRNSCALDIFEVLILGDKTDPKAKYPSTLLALLQDLLVMKLRYKDTAIVVNGKLTMFLEVVSFLKYQEPEVSLQIKTTSYTYIGSSA